MTESYIELIDLSTSREFLKKALEVLYEKKGRVNLSDFSRRCGFSSRSYIHEVLQGKKNLSQQAANQIASSLKLPRLYGKLLEVLVQSEKKKSDPSAELEKIRAQIRQQWSSRRHRVNISKFVTKPTAFQVYAALGTAETGATLAEICYRTGLKVDVVTKTLHYLDAGEALRFDGQRYFAVASQLDFLGLQDKSGLVGLSQQVASDIQKNSERILNQESNLVFYSAYSIPRSRLPHLKEKLRAALSEIVDQEQRDDGDAVVQIFLGSWNFPS